MLRTLTGAIMVAGIGLSLRGSESARSAGKPLAIVGGIPTGLLGIWDIFDSYRSAIATRREAGHGYQTGTVLPPELDSLFRCGALPCGI